MLFLTQSRDKQRNSECEKVGAKRRKHIPGTRRKENED
jgi:hypothetical protein